MDIRIKNSRCVARERGRSQISPYAISVSLSWVSSSRSLHHCDWQNWPVCLSLFRRNSCNSNLNRIPKMPLHFRYKDSWRKGIFREQEKDSRPAVNVGSFELVTVWKSDNCTQICIKFDPVLPLLLINGLLSSVQNIRVFVFLVTREVSAVSGSRTQVVSGAGWGPDGSAVVTGSG